MYALKGLADSHQSERNISIAHCGRQREEYHGHDIGTYQETCHSNTPAGLSGTGQQLRCLWSLGGQSYMLHSKGPCYNVGSFLIEAGEAAHKAEPGNRSKKGKLASCSHECGRINSACEEMGI